MIFQSIYKPVLLPISSSIQVTSRFIYELVKKYQKVGLIFFLDSRQNTLMVYSSATQNKNIIK